MAVKTKHFHSTAQTAKTPPDGTSLEEQMNAFLAILMLSQLMDVQSGVTNTSSSSIMYSGMIVYQE